MNIFSSRSRLILALFCFSAGLAAQTRSFTLTELVDAGMANSKQLKRAATQAAIAHAKLGQYRDATIPTLSYTGAYSRLSENIDPFTLELPDGTRKVLNPIIPNQFSNRWSVSEPVFAGLRAINTIRAATYLEQAAQFDADKDKADVRLNLLNAGLHLFRLQEIRKTAAQNLRSAQSRLAELRNRRDQGLALDNDVLKSELAVAQIETAIAETDNALSAARFSLAILTGLPEQTAIEIDSASVFAGGTDAATLDAYLGAAANRADLQAASARALAAEKQLKVSKGLYFPFVSVGANLYDNRPNQRVFPPEDRFKSTWDAGVTLTWNLSNLYTARHTVEEARLNQVVSGIQTQQLSDNARTEIANAYYDWQTAQGKVSLAEKAVTQAIENQRVVEAQQTQQVASASDLLEADALLLQAQINAATVRADARSAYFKLLKSAGKL